MSGKIYISEEAIAQIMSDLAAHQAQLDEMAPGAYVVDGVMQESMGPGARAAAALLAEMPPCVEAMRALFSSHIAFFASVIEGFKQADYELQVEAEELWNTMPGER